MPPSAGTGPERLQVYNTRGDAAGDEGRGPVARLPGERVRGREGGRTGVSVIFG